MINPWVILGIVFVWLASLVAVGHWQHDAGATAEKAAWQQRENEELRAANAAITELQDQARATERHHAEQMSALGQTHQKEIQHVEARRKADAAAARAGTVVLRDPGAAAREATCPCGSAAPGATTGQRDGGQTGQLSAAAAEFLLDLANDADAVADQLSACQAVIQADRNPNQEGGGPR